MADIFLRSEAKKKENNFVPLYSIRDISASLGANLKSLILFVHAWTGCDTTSAIYGLGKTSILNKLKKSERLQEKASIFGRDDATQSQISEAGLALFVAIYGGNDGDSLNHM